MQIGHIIKSERIKKGFKQSYLANGICTPSYLSKIENNQTIPSHEILEMIKNKLDISFLNLETEEDEIEVSLRRELFDIYKNITFGRELDYIKAMQKELVEMRFKYVKKDIYYDYNLVLLRILLSLNTDYNDIKNCMDQLLHDESDLNITQYYLLKKLQGIYHYNSKNSKESIMHFDEAAHVFSKTSYPEWEKADLNYMRALANLSGNRGFDAIKYSEEAFSYFRDKLFFTRAIESLCITGIAYKKLQQSIDALDIYNKALEMALKFHLDRYENVLYQNIGSLYSAIGELDKALEYFFKSLKKKETKEEKLLSIFSIIQVYSKKKDIKRMLNWIDKGVESTSNENTLIAYLYHFKLYEEFFCNHEKINMFFIKEAINFFEEKKDYRHAYKYTIKFADILKRNKKYKESSIYYEKSIYFKNENINFWEDL
ncbi:helix-turn-helix domain-containing protein [Viridibacillus sp. NPDC093762]|uniref:helix-turn-helix domain-containing protein n=1 Tax=Viridibacillus sp. NPDC093762 TaxID=3390720 RepID=UPI003D08FC06